MSHPGAYAPRVLSPAVENLVTQRSKLPGVGRRTAPGESRDTPSASRAASAGWRARTSGEITEFPGVHCADRTTSSVTSGLAKKRNGTNVVPSPGETCSTVGPYR